MFSFGDPVRLDIVVLVLTNPVDYRANIETLHPRVSRAVVEQTEIGPIPWQRTGQGESRRRKFPRDTKSFGVRGNLKLGPGEPCAVDGECQSAIIAVTKNRRVQNINCFVVETFENCARKVCR